MVKQKLKTLGAHFSAHVHGMFVNPRHTIDRIVREELTAKDYVVPLVTVIVAGIMSAIGATVWAIAFTESIVVAFIQTLWFIALLALLPIWFVAIWIIWALIFHFLGSIVSGKDVMNLSIMHRNFKLVGLAMCPFFLNILPYFSLVSGYWVWFLFTLSVRSNYRISSRGAFIVTLPFLFVSVLVTLSRFGIM